MQIFMNDGQKVPIKAWVDGVEFEDEARKQVENLASMPFVHSHVALMPDVHAGIGATVGSVIATVGAIIPAAVGVDIGCGMMAARTTLRSAQLPDDLHALRTAVERAVPHGRTDNGGPNDRGAWGLEGVPSLVRGRFQTDLEVVLKEIVAKHPKIGFPNSVLTQLATMGTGNHFFELCLDEYGSVWIMLHSGSRGIGNRIGQYFIERARQTMEKYFITLPDKDLAFLAQDTTDFNDYMQAVRWAQMYARTNRWLMLENALAALKKTGLLPSFELMEEAISCHHNYVNEEKHFGKKCLVTRKGAVRAQIGDLGIIPGSMGVRSYIVEGLGNRDSFNSCSHGAGRRMSRMKAKKIFTTEDLVAQTAGVECRKDADVIDEIPSAYKSIDAVMAAQQDLVKVKYTLKQVMCVKG